MDASGIANALAGLDITRVVDENPDRREGLRSRRAQRRDRVQVERRQAIRKLLIGKKTATGGSVYARKDDEKRVVLIGEFNSPLSTGPPSISRQGDCHGRPQQGGRARRRARQVRLRTREKDGDWCS